MLLNDKDAYEEKVRELVRLHAMPDVVFEEESFQKRIHKVSTDCEDCVLDDLSDPEGLSELSNTSGIFYEDELFQN